MTPIRRTGGGCEVNDVEVTPDRSTDPLAVAQKLMAGLNNTLLGKADVVRLVSAAALSGGHVLLDDLPGTGKTMLGKAVAAAIGGSFARVQCTPDVLPSDITGTSVFDPSTGEWSFRPGPLFAHVVLVDEINRATPRTQSALLEPMEEGQVTVDGATWSLPEPHLFIATRNPYGHSGTFPLPDSQLDRFMVVTSIGRPDRAAEAEIISRPTGPNRLDGALMTPEDLVAARASVARFTVTEGLTGYVLDLFEAVRSHAPLAPGPSTRAGVSLVALARGHAACLGRTYVTVDDIHAVAIPALSHRCLAEGSLDRAATIAALRTVLSTVPVPRG